MKISLCMIVKNESDTLARCIKSIQGIVDEAIVVDTGSTDDTPIIAARLGAKVFHIPWERDFSKARNFALAQATGDWILILDADEELAPESGAILRALVEHKRTYPTAYMLRIQNLHGEDEPVEHYVTRLFPREESAAFYGRIHEQLGPEGYWAHEASWQIRIIHHGYEEKMLTDKNKIERNQDLLQEAVDESPDNPYNWYNFGVLFQVMGDRKRAIFAYDQAIEKSKKLLQRPLYLATCYTGMAQCLLDLGEKKMAYDVCQRVPSFCMRIPDFMLTYGHVLNAMTQPHQAQQMFKRAMALAHVVEGVNSDRAAVGWKPLAGMANSYLIMQKPDDAARLYKQALNLAPGNQSLRARVEELALRGYF